MAGKDYLTSFIWLVSFGWFHLIGFVWLVLFGWFRFGFISQTTVIKPNNFTQENIQNNKTTIILPFSVHMVKYSFLSTEKQSMNTLVLSHFTFALIECLVDSRSHSVAKFLTWNFEKKGKACSLSSFKQAYIFFTPKFTHVPKVFQLS